LIRAELISGSGSAAAPLQTGWRDECDGLMQAIATGRGTEELFPLITAGERPMLIPPSS